VRHGPHNPLLLAAGVVSAGLLIIALAILFVFRWSVSPAEPRGAVLLDRWTGAVTRCWPATVDAGHKMNCTD